MLRLLRSVFDYYAFFEWRVQEHRIVRHIFLAITFIVTILIGHLAPRDWGGAQHLSFALPAILFVAGAALRAFDAYGPKHSFFQTNHRINEEAKRAAPSDVESKENFVFVPPVKGAVGGVVYSRRLNKEIFAGLWDPSINLKEKSTRYDNIIIEIRKFGRHHRRAILRNLIKSMHPLKKTLINESKVGLASDIILSASEISLYKTDYFSDFCLVTNGMKDICVTEGRDFRVLDQAWDGRMPYDRANLPRLKLREFESSVPALSFHLGVEVLAVSRDLLFRIPLQAVGVHYSQGLRAPFASGSVDWDDFEGKKVLSEGILAGARRELEEEWGGRGRKPEIKAMEVLGFFRNCDRGGKPQFVCFAKI